MVTNARLALMTTVAAGAFATDPQTLGFIPTTPEAVDAARQANTSGSAYEQDIMLIRSADSAAMIDYWDLTDAIVDGVSALRMAGEKFLPKFTDEGDKEYNYRKRCTKLTNVYRDAIEGLSSKPFEEEITVGASGDDNDDGKATVDPDIEDFIEDVDGSGNNLTIFAAQTFFNGVNSAIDWIYIDHPPFDPNIVTVADQKASGRRPYWSHVLGRNVLQANSTMVNSKETLTYIRVFEPGPPDKVRIFIKQPDGSVTWELRVKGTNWGPYIDASGRSGRTQFLQIESEGRITIDQIPYVPFITGRRDGRTFKLFPAMRDAADLQIELYQQESGLKFVKQLSAYPMLSGNGVKPTMEPGGKTVQRLAVGPGVVLYAPADASGAVGSWEFVQPDAALLKFLADDIDATINQLRELARQPLTAQSANLTVIGAATAAGKSKSAVKQWAFMLKDTLENGLVITYKYLGKKGTDAPPVNVYTEFDEFMDGKDLDTLNLAREAKEISQLTYWEELRRRSVLGPEFTAEREQKRLMDELPGDGPDTGEGAPGSLVPPLPVVPVVQLPKQTGKQPIKPGYPKP